MQPPAIKIELKDDVTVIVTSGELDLSVADALAERIASIGDGRAIVSLVESTYIDSTILTVLVKATKTHGERFAVLLPETHRLRRIFEIANVGAILHVAATYDEARALVEKN